MRGACVPPSASSSTRGVAGCSQKGRRALLGGAGRGLQPPCPPPQGQRPGRRVPGASRGCQPFPSSELMLLLLLPPGRGLEGSRSQRFSSSHLPGVALPRTLLRVWEQRGAAAAAGVRPRCARGWGWLVSCPGASGAKLFFPVCLVQFPDVAACLSLGLSPVFFFLPPPFLLCFLSLFAWCTGHTESRGPGAGFWGTPVGLAM